MPPPAKALRKDEKVRPASDGAKADGGGQSHRQAAEARCEALLVGMLLRRSVLTEGLNSNQMLQVWVSKTSTLRCQQLHGQLHWVTTELAKFQDVQSDELGKLHELQGSSVLFLS